MLCTHVLHRVCRCGIEVAGWTVDRKFRVRIPAYPVTTLMARRLRTSERTSSDVPVPVSG